MKTAVSQRRKRNIRSTIMSYQQHKQDLSSIRSILRCITHQISPYENSPSAKTVMTLISTLVHEYSNFLEKSNRASESLNDTTMHLDDFSCPHCHELLHNPVTLMCGHSVCKGCYEDKPLKHCIVCGYDICEYEIIDYRTNITLSSLLRICHPNESKGRDLINTAMQLFRKRNYREAIATFSEALLHAPDSHVALTYRAQSQLMVGMTKQALDDAFKACSIASKWYKVHQVKGDVLYKLQLYKEALLSYLMCLVLKPDTESVLEQVKTIIQTLLELPLQVSSKRGRTDSNVSEQYNMDCSGSQNSETNFHTSLLEHSRGIMLKLGHTAITADVKKGLERVLYANPVYNRKTNREPVHKERVIDPTLIGELDLECSLCMRLFHDPVCTPCGHTFCRMCLERCLDHDTHCPLCKISMESYLSSTLISGGPKCDHVTRAFIWKYLPGEYQTRLKQHEEDVEELRKNVPVFVCTTAFPSLSCPLHIYEPRYKLMLRRCMQYNDRQFGMCLPHPNKPHSEVGTLLKVRDVTYFPDGRSAVDCVGVKRFRSGNSRLTDGYNTAELEFIVDVEVTDPDATVKLMKKVYQDALDWFNLLPESLSTTIRQHYGEFPQENYDIKSENGPDWHWWVLAILPAAEGVKMKILGLDSLQQRLCLIRKIFSCLKRRNET